MPKIVFEMLTLSFKGVIVFILDPSTQNNPYALFGIAFSIMRIAASLAAAAIAAHECGHVLQDERGYQLRGDR